MGTAGPEGMPASAIGKALDAASSHLFFHVSHLSHVAQAGLVESRLEGRSIRYCVAHRDLSGLTSLLLCDPPPCQ